MRVGCTHAHTLARTGECARGKGARAHKEFCGADVRDATAPEKLEAARHYLVHEKSVEEEEEERRTRAAQAVEDAAQHK